MMLHTTVGLHWTSSPPPDKFPGLGFEGDRGQGGYQDKCPYQDPGQTRLAAAVKKAAPVPLVDT